MSAGDRGRDLGDLLVAELRALLERASRVTCEREPLTFFASDPAIETPLQAYANELRDLCQRVLDDADEETARVFWTFLIETAVRHGRRAA